MRFTAVVSAAVLTVAGGVQAAPGFGGGFGGFGGGYGGGNQHGGNYHLGNGFNFGFNLNKGNCYGAPIPPWKPKCKPGWYLGGKPQNHPGIPCLTDNTCKWVNQFGYNWGWSNKLCGHKPTTSHHYPSSTPCPSSTSSAPPSGPTPVDGYTPTFVNITAATQDDSYMTFGLVDTVEDCLAMCDNVDGCVFANTYHDVNGKDGSPQFTCSLFSKCQDESTADNRGGQTQPDGSVDYITDSTGWCKGS